MIDAFYSDPHFGHARIIELCNRPFSDVETMNVELIKRYNSKVSNSDLVVWLGDCFFGMPVERAKFILDCMNGRKILVLGGHDGSASRMLRMGFEIVAHELTTAIGNRTFTLSHFPYAHATVHAVGKDERHLDLRPKKIKGRVLIHGHIHTKWKQHGGDMIHVGVDAWDFYPVTRGEIITLLGGPRACEMSPSCPERPIPAP